GSEIPLFLTVFINILRLTLHGARFTHGWIAFTDIPRSNFSRFWHQILPTDLGSTLRSSHVSDLLVGIKGWPPDCFGRDIDVLTKLLPKVCPETASNARSYEVTFL